MAKKDKHVSETPATQWLKAHGVPYTEHPYDYVDHGGTAESARQLGWDEHAVIKTLVMQDERSQPLVVLMHGNCSVSTKNLAREIGCKSVQPLVVLMHGDCTVSTKNLAREIGCKSVEPCKPEVAQRHSGYLVGGTSPFGFRKQVPVYVESTILELSRILINGGRRGFLVGIEPSGLIQPLGGRSVSCALPQ